MKENTGERGKVDGDMHTHTHAFTPEKGKELCLCYKKMSAPMTYSKLNKSFISSANITLSHLRKKKSSIYKCQSARFILELTFEMPATIYQLKGIYPHRRSTKTLSCL